MDRSDETLNNICSLLERTLNVLTKCPALPFFLSKPLRILYFVNHVSKHLLSPLLIGSLSLNVFIRPNHSQDSLAFILFFSFFSLSNIQFSNEKSNIGSLLLDFQLMTFPLPLAEAHQELSPQFYELAVVKNQSFCITCSESPTTVPCELLPYYLFCS